MPTMLLSWAMSSLLVHIDTQKKGFFVFISLLLFVLQDVSMITANRKTVDFFIAQALSFNNVLTGKYIRKTVHFNEIHK